MVEDIVTALSHIPSINDWMKDEAAETAEGVRFAHLAVQLAPNDQAIQTALAL